MTHTNPWKDIESELLKAIGHPHVNVADLPPDTFVARFYAARAADAAQIASLTAQVREQRERALAAERELWPLRAERDAAHMLASEVDAARAHAEAQYRTSMARLGDHAVQVMKENTQLKASLEAAFEEAQTLREALTSIANSACCECCQEAALVARAALAPRPPEPQ